MNDSAEKVLKIAILDLNAGWANQSMRCLREILANFGKEHQTKMEVSEFDIRQTAELPGMDFDVYLSSGGPGNPLEELDTDWQQAYFQWLDTLHDFNDRKENRYKKQAFFICYSFELYCMHYALGKLTLRKSPSFGVFPVHNITQSFHESVFEGLPDPFFVLDSRDLQVIQPNHQRIKERGATLLTIEKERPHVPLERCIMAMRFNENMIGTQFHPEADPTGTAMHLNSPERKEQVIAQHGAEKWQSMMNHLNDPDKILLTYSQVIPNFLKLSVQKKQMIQEKSAI
jgi:GMP synthase-like glutamine amidotransferase